MSLDQVMDDCFKCLLIVFSVSLTLLVPVWAWSMFRLYVPKRKEAGNARR